MTAYTQPAILTTSIALYTAFSEGGIVPDLVAGHSLGEYSALVAAGSLNFADAVRIVHHAGTSWKKRFPREKGLCPP